VETIVVPVSRPSPDAIETVTSTSATGSLSTSRTPTTGCRSKRIPFCARLGGACRRRILAGGGLTASAEKLTGEPFRADPEEFAAMAWTV
jgi:hypothetical protein